MTETTPHAIEMSYTGADIAALNLLIWRYWLIVIAIIGVAMIVVPLIVGVLDGYSVLDSLSYLDWPFVGLMIVILTLWIVVVSMASYWFRRADLRGPIHLTLTDEGVQFRNPKMEGLTFWRAIRSVKVRGDRLFLFISRRAAFILPRRAFASAEAFAACAAYAEERQAALNS